MTFDFTLPPPELTGAFDGLEAWLKKDTGGESARRLGSYFASVEIEARQRQLRSTDFEERHMAELLGEAFGAARRVVAAAWSKFHGRELAS